MGDYKPATLEIPLRCGHKLVLSEMTLLDLEDAEEEIGKPRSEWFKDGKVSTKAITTMIWVCARGHGLTPEQRARGEWLFGRREMAAWITDKDLVDAMERIQAFFLQTQDGTPDGPGSEPSAS